MNYYVYAYCDPLQQSIQLDEFNFPGSPFYIGYGIRNRMFDHLKEARAAITSGIVKGNRHKIYSIIALLNANVNPAIVILKDNLTKDDAKRLEIKLISGIGRRIDGTGTLTNIAMGGDGGDTLSQNPRMLNGEITLDHSGAKNPMFGKFGLSNPKTKTYRFTFPDGSTNDIIGGKEFTAYLRTIKISPTAAFDVIKCRKEHHKGIKILKIQS